MKISRRSFIKTGALASGGILIAPSHLSNITAKNNLGTSEPVVLTTWDFGYRANAKTIELINEGKNSLDAIEAGIKIIEEDPTISSVGYGGFPDEDGIVTLDASVMDWNGNAGSVAAIEGIKNPFSVAKLVMQRTKHVMLAGDGAKKFALENGFKEENLLTDEAKKAWLEWKQKYPHGQNRIDPNIHHDTIGMIAIDKNNNMSGGVSTSGLAFKIHGRVGDSPIIGAAMFVDNEVGGAVATGNGEFMMKTLGAFLIVEKMREGFSPQQACEFAVERAYKHAKNRLQEGIQVCYLALNKNGEHGSYSLADGFQYALTTSKENKVYKSNYLVK